MRSELDPGVVSLPPHSQRGQHNCPNTNHVRYTWSQTTHPSHGEATAQPGAAAPVAQDDTHSISPVVGSDHDLVILGIWPSFAIQWTLKNSELIDHLRD